MQQGFPLVVNVDMSLSGALKGLPSVAAKIQAWINFAALKAAWYADETCVVEIEFTLMDEPTFSEKTTNLSPSKWTVEPTKGFALTHDKSTFKAQVLLGFSSKETQNCTASSAALEPLLQSKLTHTANLIGRDYGLRGL
jgi:hypothetical protein